MFKKITTAFFCLLVSFLSVAQCVPDTLYQDSTANIWPTSGFPDATVGVSYSQTWTMKIPATLIEAALGDTSFVTIDTLGQSIYIGDWIVDSVVTISVLNTPPGMSVDCNTPNCSFPGGSVACAEINGTPTIPDWYNLQIISNLYSHGVVTVNVGGVPLTLPVSVNYFEQLGYYDTVSRYMITVNQASSVFDLKSELEITGVSNKDNSVYLEISDFISEDFEIQITDVVGRTIYQGIISTNIGRNTYILNKNLEEGIYIISLYNKNRNLSQKIYLSSN